jgi:LacI family transcriptional regulator
VSSIKHARPRVALAFPVGLAHLHRSLQGIKEYVSTHTNWTLVVNTETAEISLQSLRDWDGNGAIGVIYSADDLEEAHRLKFPFVSMSLAGTKHDFYFVRADHQQIGRTAGEHLKSCGFKNFAFYGITNALYARERLAGFEQAIAPCKPSVLTTGNDTRAALALQNVSSGLCDWLLSLTRPVGVFAANDARARAIADACLELDIHVPDEVAIVGVDDNEVMCQFGTPTLTSIPCNRHLIGYQAAEVLDRLMCGLDVPIRDTVIPPEQIRPRESSDVGIFTNPHATRAYRIVRDHIGEMFGAEELARNLGITRRRLEQCIKDATGQTPYEFICALRVEHARQVMQEESLSLEEVAKTCGFRDARHLRKVFVKFTDQTPSDFRRQLASPWDDAS